MIMMPHKEFPQESKVPDQKQNQDQRVIKDQPWMPHDCNSNKKESDEVEDTGN